MRGPGHRNRTVDLAGLLELLDREKSEGNNGDLKSNLV